jgi:NAD(P)-dependent dehydrogenase (short-subunit alcohol dehydrogenase family)
MSRGVSVHRDWEASCRRRPIPRIGQPEEIARVLLFLASADTSYRTGDTFAVDGGLLAGPAPL